MKVDFTFLHVDSSDAFMDYAVDRIEKIAKFELKPMDIHFTISMQKYECIVEVSVLEGRRKFKAQAITDDFYRAVEMVVNKLTRQMSKDKRRLKNHKNAERSDYGQLNRLTPELEMDYQKDPIRKAS